MVKPKKNLGQHFLRDGSVVDRIVAAIEQMNPDLIIEIGPGEGVLTERLLPHHPDLQVVELDVESVEHLRNRFGFDNDRLHHADFLQWNFPAGDWVVVGNFPYNISSQIVFRLLEHKEQVRAMVGMFQKEVAERIASPPGSRDYGILSVLVQTYYEVTYLFSVDENAFYPPPKVKSGVISLKRKDGFVPDCDPRFLVQLVKTAFNQRRKMLRNTLKPWLSEERLPSVATYLEMRPEQLGFEDFVKLAAALKP